MRDVVTKMYVCQTNLEYLFCYDKMKDCYFNEFDILGLRPAFGPTVYPVQPLAHHVAKHSQVKV